MTDSISKNVQSLPEVADSSVSLGLKFLQTLRAFSHLRASAHTALSNPQSPCFPASSPVFFKVWLRVISSRKSSLTPPSQLTDGIRSCPSFFGGAGLVERRMEFLFFFN